MDAVDAHENTPLMDACFMNRPDVVGAIISSAAFRKNYNTSGADAALEIACKRGYIDVLNALLACDKVDVNATLPDSMLTPIQLASKKGCLGCVKRLLQDGRTDWNMASAPHTPLSYACRRNDIDLINTLLSCEDVDVNSMDSSGQTQLMQACALGHTDAVRALLACDRTDVNKTSHEQRTALHVAVVNGNSGCVRCLLGDARTDANAAHISGDTALIMACRNAHGRVVEAMLSSESVDVNARNRLGQTAFFVACAHGNAAALQVLMTCERVNIDIKDNNGTPALHAALIPANITCIRLLLRDERTDLTATDKRGNTALHIAASLLLCSDWLLSAMMARQVDVRKANHRGETVLHIAAAYSRAEWVAWLLRRRDVDVNALDHRQRHACECVFSTRAGSRINMVQLLDAFCACDRLNLTMNSGGHRTVLGCMLSIYRCIPNLPAMLVRCDVRTMLSALGTCAKGYRPILRDTIRERTVWGVDNGLQQRHSRGAIVHALVLASVRGWGAAQLA